MSYFNKRTSSGVFITSGSSLTEYKGEKGNGSINDVTVALGYHPNQVYSPNIIDGNGQIFAVLFEIFTRNVVAVFTSVKMTYVTEKDLRKFLVDFSVTKEFTSLRINDTLSLGTENGSLTVDFLAKVLKLKNVARNGMFYAERIKTYLHFTDGVLTDFQNDDGLFTWAKHLQEANKIVFNWIADLAYKYWPDDDFKAKKEINIQCEAWAMIPEAFGNEYVSLHRTENGGANLHMIRVCHYGYPISLSQFQEINHGRYSFVLSDVNIVIFRCCNFLYFFDEETGQLLESRPAGNSS